MYSNFVFEFQSHFLFNRSFGVLITMHAPPNLLKCKYHRIACYNRSLHLFWNEFKRSISLTFRGGKQYASRTLKFSGLPYVNCLITMQVRPDLEMRKFSFCFDITLSYSISMEYSSI